MINENLFNDLFLDSHRDLAINSLQTLNNFNNFLVVEHQFGIDVAEICNDYILRDNRGYKKTYKTKYDTEIIPKKTNFDILYNSTKQSWVIYNNRLLKCSCSGNNNNLYLEFNIY